MKNYQKPETDAYVLFQEQSELLAGAAGDSGDLTGTDEDIGWIS